MQIYRCHFAVPVHGITSISFAPKWGADYISVSLVLWPHSSDPVRQINKLFPNPSGIPTKCNNSEIPPVVSFLQLRLVWFSSRAKICNWNTVLVKCTHTEFEAEQHYYHSWNELSSAVTGLCRFYCCKFVESVKICTLIAHFTCATSSELLHMCTSYFNSLSSLGIKLWRLQNFLFSVFLTAHSYRRRISSQVPVTCFQVKYRTVVYCNKFYTNIWLYTQTQ